MSTVKFINEIIYSNPVFQLVPFNLKYINVTQSFTGDGIAGKCFHQFHFETFLSHQALVTGRVTATSNNQTQL